MRRVTLLSTLCLSVQNCAHFLITCTRFRKRYWI